MTRQRPEVAKGITRKIKTGCGSLYVTINEFDDQISEVIASMGKAGGCSASQTEGLTRIITLALSSGVEIEKIIKQLKGIRCPSPAKDYKTSEDILSCSDAIAKAIEAHYNKRINSDKSKVEETEKQNVA